MQLKAWKVCIHTLLSPCVIAAVSLGLSRQSDPEITNECATERCFTMWGGVVIGFPRISCRDSAGELHRT
jgi:hypothetical protein